MAGRIQLDQVPDVMALVKSETPNNSVVLDLKEVKLVDRDAVRFLAESEAKGAKLRNCSAFIREWISRERHAMQRRETEPQHLSGAGD